MRKERQGTRFVVIDDTLHANAPTVHLLREHGQGFILTVKDKSHTPDLEQPVEVGYRDDAVDTMTCYRWCHDAHLNAPHGDTCRVTLVEQERCNRRRGKHHLCTNMVLLVFIAFTIDQVNSLACDRFQATLEHSRAITRCGKSSALPSNY